MYIRITQKFSVNKYKMGYEQPMPLFSFKYSRLHLGALHLQYVHQRSLSIAFNELFHAVTVWLVLLKRSNTYTV